MSNINILTEEVAKRNYSLSIVEGSFLMLLSIYPFKDGQSKHALVNKTDTVKQILKKLHIK